MVSAVIKVIKIKDVSINRIIIIQLCNVAIQQGNVFVVFMTF